MTHLPQLSGRELIRVLRQAGWVESRQKGSHVLLKRADGTGRVTVPNHARDLKEGTVRSILKEVDLTVEQFNQLRKGI